MNKKNMNQIETGRSMVEMLGVLAVMALLSIVGILGLRSALDSAKANQIIQALSRRATVLAADKTFGTGFTDNASFGQDTDYTITCSDVPDVPFFICTVQNVEQKVCQKILDLNWELPLRIKPEVCQSENEMSFLFAIEGKVPTFCDDDLACPPQATCENGVCIEPTPNVCDDEIPCADECQRCNPETLRCENACTRKSYLQSTGTQWIDTGYAGFSKLGTKVEFKLQATVSYNPASQWHYCFGAYDGSEESLFATGFPSNPTVPNRTFRAYGNGPGVYARNVAAGSTDVLEGSMWATQQGYYIKINGQQYFTSRSTVDYTYKKSIALFGLKGGGSPGYFIQMKLYYLKIYHNGTLVRDFIPVLDKENTPAVYDKIDKKLYYNQGSGQFITD